MAVPDTPPPDRPANLVAVDRGAVDKVLALNPQAARQARGNRAFLRRVVRYLAGQGVRQFLDLGSGVPTVGHVHEIAHATDAEARVVYVDNEPVAAAYTRRLLNGVANTAVVEADLTEVASVLDHPETRALLDLDQPVAVLMFAVLHFLHDDAAVDRLVAAYRDCTAAGSYLAVSHVCADENPTMRVAEGLYRQGTSLPFCTRSRAQVTAMFTGYDLVEPGVVYVADWRPDPGPDPNAADPAIAGGLGRKA